MKHHADSTSRKTDRLSHLTSSDCFFGLRIHLCQLLKLGGVRVSSVVAEILHLLQVGRVQGKIHLF